MNPLPGDLEVVMRLDADPGQIGAVRRAVEELCTRAGFSEDDTADVGLSLNEALANVIRHAYCGQRAKPIDVHAAVTAGEISIVIRDWGSGVVPDLDKPPPDPAVQAGGLGLLCLRETMDAVDYLPQPDGMILRLTKRMST